LQPKLLFLHPTSITSQITVGEEAGTQILKKNSSLNPQRKLAISTSKIKITLQAEEDHIEQFESNQKLSLGFNLPKPNYINLC